MCSLSWLIQIERLNGAIESTAVGPWHGIRCRLLSRRLNVVPAGTLAENGGKQMQEPRQVESVGSPQTSRTASMLLWDKLWKCLNHPHFCSSFPLVGFLLCTTAVIQQMVHQINTCLITECHLGNNVFVFFHTAQWMLIHGRLLCKARKTAKKEKKCALLKRLMESGEASSPLL